MSSDSSRDSSKSSFDQATESFIKRRRDRRKKKNDGNKDGMRHKKGGGSKTGKSGNKDRGREAYHELLMHDYFDVHPVYDNKDFHHHFHMSRNLFDCILNRLVEHDDYFIRKHDALGNHGFSPHQKLTCALHFLAYGTSTDQLDEYIRMGESTSLQNLERFC